jgi:hypothetical protein
MKNVFIYRKKVGTKKYYVALTSHFRLTLIFYGVTKSEEFFTRFFLMTHHLKAIFYSVRAPINFLPPPSDFVCFFACICPYDDGINCKA